MNNSINRIFKRSTITIAHIVNNALNSFFRQKQPKTTENFDKSGTFKNLVEVITQNVILYVKATLEKHLNNVSKNVFQNTQLQINYKNH